MKKLVYLYTLKTLFLSLVISVALLYSVLVANIYYI